MKGKMAIIGDGDSVHAFRAVGIETFPVSGKDEAVITLKKIAKSYAIIFITDDVAKQIDEVIKNYVSLPYPIIVPVPSKSGSNGYGMSNIKSAMEKALGVDILFNNNKDV